MVGGLGNDTYIVDNTGGIVSETSTLSTEIDTVQAGLSYTLGANVENLSLTGTAANTIGSLSHDNYVVANTGDSVAETPGEGIGTVQTGAGYALSDNAENLTLTSGMT